MRCRWIARLKKIGRWIGKPGQRPSARGNKKPMLPKTEQVHAPLAVAAHVHAVRDANPERCIRHPGNCSIGAESPKLISLGVVVGVIVPAAEYQTRRRRHALG